jgi:S-(hydroxymethyl)glutathione dehydrogenase / alcohol dehydrogenase
MPSARALVSRDGTRFVTDLEFAPPGPREVMVAIEASGLCHTDLYVSDQPGMYVLGHEGAGVIEQVGAGVADVAVGERVVLNWAMPCGACFQCACGSQHLCERQSPLLTLGGWNGPAAPLTDSGVQAHRAFGLGTMATRTVVPASAVWAIGDMPFASAAILGCGVMTGVGSVLNVARVNPGERVVVIGCGGVGLSVVQGARLAGAGQIIAVDLSADRRAMAARFGATCVIAPDDSDEELIDVARQVHAMTSGRGADYAFECTGVPSLAATPLRMIRHGGTALQISGFDATVPIDLSLFMFDKLYINPLYGRCAPARDFPRLLDLYRSGRLLLDEMVTRTYALDDTETAIADLLAGRNAKGVVVFE